MPHCSQLHFQHSTLRGQHLGSTIRQARACKSINSTARCCRLTALKASSTSTSNTLMLQHHQQQQRQLAGQCRRHHDSRAAAAARPQLRCRAVPTASPAVDPYTQVAQLCAAEGPVVVGQTPRGRGLVVSEDMPEREALLTVPLHHALIIADEPTSGISIFSDKQHRRWQEVHGPLPPLLLEFLQGDARWDARMAAWLLWMVQHPGPLWRSYLSLLPAESDMCCLLNYSQAELEELQVPSLKDEAVIQAGWCAHLHAKYFSAASGSLSPLKLSTSLSHSLWAISLVRSRTFSEDVNGEMLTLVVPYCDMANHCSDNNSTFCISRDYKSFSLRSLRPLRQGEELTISYGATKPNCESLRDYGFVLAGNSHDRIQFAADDDTKNNNNTAASSGSSGSNGAGKDGGSSSLYGLNEACLMEAAGFTGDLAAGNIQPSATATAALQGAATDPQQLSRREAALLSMPLRSTTNSSGSGGGGGLFGWLTEASQPWTESGKPPPQPLRKDQVPAERAAVRALQAQVQQQLAVLPTSIHTDQMLLAEMEARSSSSSSSKSSKGASSTGNSSSTTTTTTTMPQQRRQSRLQQQERAGVVPRTPADAYSDRPLSRARIMTAVRARLEHKLLLQEGLHVLQQYEHYLTARFGA